MKGYSKNRQQFRVPLPDVDRANDEILASYPLEAGVEITIYALFAYMRTAASAAGCAIVVKQDGTLVAGCTLTLAASSGAKTNPLSAPVVVKGATGGSRIEVIVSTADTTGVGDFFLDMEQNFKAFA